MPNSNFFQKLKQILDIPPSIYGQGCINLLLKQFSRTFDFSHVIYAEKSSQDSDFLKTNVYLVDSKFQDNFEYNAKGTPCDHVVSRNKVCIYPKKAAAEFPKDEFLVDNKIEFYAGTPVYNSKDELTGILVVLDKINRTDSDEIEAIMQILSTRIANEIYKELKDQEIAKINQELKIKNTQLVDLESISHTGYWELDLKTEKTYLSEEVYNIYGIPKDTPLDRLDGISYYEEAEQQRLIKYMDDCVRENKSFSDVFKFQDHNGTKKWVSVQAHLIEDESGPIKIVGAVQDVTEKFQNFYEQARLRNDLSEYEETINRFLIVVKTDTKGNITYANDNLCKISGYSQAELIGKNYRILNSGHHSFDFFRELWDTISNGESWEGKICNRAKDGSEYWVHSFIFPLKDENGEIAEYVAFRVDITSSKMLEKQLADQKEKLSFASQLATVGEMSAGIAHEIANPLAVISGCAVMLARETLDEVKRQKAIVNLNKSVGRIGKIVKGLHYLSRRSKDDSFNLNNITDILGSTLDFCEEALKKHFIKLEINKPDYDILIHCSDIKISQILLNLINNARDAIIDSQVSEKWIRIIFNDAPNELEILVIDSGPGIPDNIKSKILESFFTTKQIGKGTGLGLSLVNRFVKEHGGNLSIEEIDGNNTFKIVLPKKNLDLAI